MVDRLKHYSMEELLCIPGLSVIILYSHWLIMREGRDGEGRAHGSRKGSSFGRHRSPTGGYDEEGAKSPRELTLPLSISTVSVIAAINKSQ